MKNLKVRNKLWLGFGSIIMFTLLIAGLALSGMGKIKKEADVLVNRTLTNTEYVWELRRNLMSESRYHLLALVDTDPVKTNTYVDHALQEIERNKEILELYRKNYTGEKDKFNQLDEILNRQSGYRDELVRLLRIETNEATVQAYGIFINHLYPILDEEGAVIAQMGEEQLTMANKQIERVSKVYYGVLAIVITALILTLLMSAFMIRKIRKAIMTPLDQMEDATSALVDGDFSVDINYESRDEFGTACSSIQTSFAELKRVIHCTASALGEIADGNFAIDPQMDFKGEMEEIERAGSLLLNKMNELFAEIKSSADQIRAGSDQVACAAQELAHGATEQASSVEELSASITEISRNVTENAKNSKKANELATVSGEVAKSTMHDMQEMLAAMNRISMSAESIGKVIKVIDDITFQTNILSLNAAVEAARAGAAGKGFAVVADEVRNLAQKSSESAKEITELIENAIAAVNQGEGIAQKTSQAFNELAGQINDVISTVNEIATASEEQATSIQQITLGVEQISAVVQTNSATSEESAAASEELSSQANILNSLMDQFQLR